MSFRQNGTNGDVGHALQVDSDMEEETLANDYQEQTQYDEGLDDEMGGGMAFGGSQQDIQAQMQAVVTPLEYTATLETKFASYDNYCSLFHYILNSDGPVELELPSVGARDTKQIKEVTLTRNIVLLGVGRHRRIHLPIQQLL